MKTPLAHGLMLFALGLPAAAAACGLDGNVIDSKTLSAVHPGSIDVALGVRQLIDERRVAELPTAAPGLVYQRASQTLRALKARLQTEGPQDPTALLIVEYHLWARWQGSGDTLEMQIHVDGPQPGDTVILTGEAVLTALLQRQLTMDQAQQAGAYRVEPAGVTTAHAGPLSSPGDPVR
ncbi:hypothetical protein [Piscinibacter gummiphilus]|uniref:Uncharacterized protein n=1 Tax=Piscinibacter gummiphilus TaxID=946333 RepID=A0A1W6LD56_9BURK|nr:hypothetical protein [Piscinibacter gummiphilus]ARN22182.1 hypothetical protein A4W93_21030 [Piscinibacter gummiphilus]ATU66871.1 hypothetical protein CPZ87_21125 [Piscinibacter gummiphilus]GLS94278.1 hypothetical protein GCM10007918_15700 [Piscinibacter gummiphilus]